MLAATRCYACCYPMPLLLLLAATLTAPTGHPPPPSLLLLPCVHLVSAAAANPTAAPPPAPTHVCVPPPFPHSVSLHPLSFPPAPPPYPTGLPQPPLSHAQMDQARSSQPHPADRRRQFTRDPRRRSLRSVSPCYNFAKGPHPVCHRSRSKGVSLWRSGSFDAKQRRPFRANKPPPVCPKCLGRHNDRLDHLPCNSSSLWDNSSPSHCSCNQQGCLLNMSGRALCWDFQCPRGCSGQGHNHECSGCGDPTHGAQECPRRQRTAGSPMK